MKNEPPTLIDLDRIAAWVFDPKQSIYPKRWLDAWNWLIDLARSIGATRSRVVISYEHASENDAYDKLFFGNNLPSIKHDPYVRKWSDAEITELRAIFQDGLNLFDQAIQSAPD